jgi:SAM-dependent methyltransferase
MAGATVRPVVHQHALAYLLGIEGIALLRGYLGERDREFVAARLAEVRALLADETLAGAAVEVDAVTAVEGYHRWSATYDDGRNPAFDLDEPILLEILDELAPAAALDAACGTGRWAELLAARDHRVIGVDGSSTMLDRARRRVPAAEFRTGDLHELPVADASVNLVVCALALTHLPDLRPAFAEFARVLRPGGHLLVSDMHAERVLRGSVPTVRDSAGRPGLLPAYRHLVGDYLRAALPVGLRVRRCEEPVPPVGELLAPTREPGPWELWPWSLAAMVPEAARAAGDGSPAEIVWHFQLDVGPAH